MTKNPQVILKGRYQVVPRTLILVFDGGKVLLQKGSPTKKIWPGCYNGLGGHIERGEDVLSAARRELHEEAQLECTDLHLCGTVTIDVEETNGILMFVLTGKKVLGELQESDEGSLHWIEVRKLMTLPVVEDIPDIVARIIYTEKENALFHAHYGYDAEGKRITTFG